MPSSRYSPRRPYQVDFYTRPDIMAMYQGAMPRMPRLRHPRLPLLHSASCQRWPAGMPCDQRVLRCPGFLNATVPSLPCAGFVQTIVNRVNTINGRTYKEDPTIMAWVSGQDARGTPAGASAGALRTAGLACLL